MFILQRFVYTAVTLVLLHSLQIIWSALALDAELWPYPSHHSPFADSVNEDEMLDCTYGNKDPLLTGDSSVGGKGILVRNGMQCTLKTGTVKGPIHVHEGAALAIFSTTVEGEIICDKCRSIHVVMSPKLAKMTLIEPTNGKLSISGSKLKGTISVHNAWSFEIHVAGLCGVDEYGTDAVLDIQDSELGHFRMSGKSCGAGQELSKVSLTNNVIFNEGAIVCSIRNDVIRLTKTLVLTQNQADFKVENLETLGDFVVSHNFGDVNLTNVKVTKWGVTLNRIVKGISTMHSTSQQVDGPPSQSEQSTPAKTSASSSLPGSETSAALAASTGAASSGSEPEHIATLSRTVIKQQRLQQQVAEATVAATNPINGESVVVDQTQDPAEIADIVNSFLSWYQTQNKKPIGVLNGGRDDHRDGEDESKRRSRI